MIKVLGQNTFLLKNNLSLYSCQAQIAAPKQLDAQSPALQLVTAENLFKIADFPCDFVFDVLQNAKVVVVGEKDTKTLKFFNIEERKLICTFNSWKKVTQLVAIEHEEPKLEGVMVADKTGEVRFLALQKAQENEVLEYKDDAQEHHAKSLFGHQQALRFMRLDHTKSKLISLDTMNRVRVSDFPEVYLQTQCLLNHDIKSKITHQALFGNFLASYSSEEQLTVANFESGINILNEFKLEKEPLGLSASGSEKTDLAILTEEELYQCIAPREEFRVKTLE